jgi:hypothetical protein
MFSVGNVKSIMLGFQKLLLLSSYNIANTYDYYEPLPALAFYGNCISNRYKRPTTSLDITDD